jgi:citrate synthase
MHPHNPSQSLKQPTQPNKQIEVSEGGTIPAAALKKITAGGDGVGLRTYDPGYTNTAAVISRISYIDGDRGILRYRGYPIEELAEQNYFEVCVMGLVVGV